MRGNFLYLPIILLWTSSCSQEKLVPISINPIRIDINGHIEVLREKLEKRSTLLVYENSYEGESKGIKLFYFDDQNDGLHYHFAVYTIDDRIKGIEAGVSSSDLTSVKLYRKVEKEILPDFKKTAKQLDNANVKTEKSTLSESEHYYIFEVKTQEFNEKIQ